MQAKCYKCGLVWNISILHKMSKLGYECPHCEQKRKGRVKDNAKKN